MSSKKFILGSILTCFVFLVVYDAAIRKFISKRPASSESQWSANIVAAQEIVYRSTSPHTVIVGTSLATRLRPEMFGGDVFNLAFGAKSTFDGLQILERSGHTPDLVLVETNLLTHFEDSEFIDQLFWQPVYILRQYFPALLERYRPMNELRRVLVAPIRVLMDTPGSAYTYWRRKLGNGDKVKAPVVENQEQISNDKRLFEQLVEQQFTARSAIPDEESTRRAKRQLLQIIKILHLRGSAVVLFEMPMHPRVCNASGSIHMRQALASLPPTDGYLQLPSPDCEGYQTTDGIHLPADQALQFVRFLVSEVDRYGLTIGRDD